MADRRRKHLGRSSSTESTEYSITMGKSVRKKKPKERWLLTRKTWRYMADAGRKLIPDGAQNRVEDIPKIEAYFQEVCKKEARFLLWRKNSYPGAVFRKRHKEQRKGGSCRKATSADEAEFVKLERPKDLAIPSTSGVKYDIQKMKEDFLNKPPTPTDYSGYTSRQHLNINDNLPSNLTGSSERLNEEEHEEKQLVNMLEQYLSLANVKELSKLKSRPDFNYQELVDKLQRHLTVASRYTSNPYNTNIPRRTQVHFNGDHVQKSLTETLSRYFSQSTNRDKVISDLLTDRKALEKLYFELRKTKGFRGSRGGTGYPSPSLGYGSSSSLGRNSQNSSPDSINERRKGTVHPPPLIEIESETISFKDHGIQTVPILEETLNKVEEDFKKSQIDAAEPERKEVRPTRRRSSVDNDDVSQSVSDTIKRYLRMARKKSVDTDKVDRFKRVNYDRNLRNIRAKGEITKPGDDDGLSKGCQTNDDWILTYRDLKFDEIPEVSDESRVSSSRSSIDIGNLSEDGAKSLPCSPPAKSGSHSFLSHFLHSGKHDKTDNKHDSRLDTKQDKSSSAAVASGAAMQKSKSSSSVMHHGSRLVAKKIFRSRSKSQTRPSQGTCSWTPQGSCIWNNVTGRQVILNDTTSLQLTEVERKVLQKVAIAKLQALSLGVTVKVPTESVGVPVNKPKKRPYLLKRKALTTGIFDTSRKDDKDKDNNNSGGLVFGIPLTQCVENDRISRAAAGSPFRGELSGSADEPVIIGRHGSRASFSSLIEGARPEETGSCENLLSAKRMVGSVPGLLDTLSCSSTADIPGTTLEEESSVPNILSVCFRYLEQHGLNTLGIFRVSTSKKRIRQLREDFDCGKETTLDEEQCPHDVATLLKEYLRDLPDPLLCRDLYHAFVQTQRIRNRRLQFEALQYLIQLLPPANRDTLFALLNFLGKVAKHSGDTTDQSSGECISGNKMDSNNLATVFAPNILHCIKPGAKDTSADRPEDRIDIINVVRTLIDHYGQLFVVTAELLDEVYLHMMDSHPEALEQLLNKRDAIAAAADESVDELDSESNSAPWTPTQPSAEITIETVMKSYQTDETQGEHKKTYSREKFLHETAATGGPNIGMRIRHKDRIRERSSRRKQEESLRRKKEEESSTGMSPTMAIISRLRGQKDDEYVYGKNRSSSLESSSSTHTDSDITRILRITDDLQERRKSSPYVLNNSGVITASLTIPVQPQHQYTPSYNVDDDIPYIEDGESGRQQFTIGVIRTPTAPPRRRQHSISGSDSSVASNVQPITGSLSLVQSFDSAVGSSATYSSPVQNTPTSVSSSIADAGTYSSPTSWASTPPTSPDSTNTSVNYIPDDIQPPKSITKPAKSIAINKEPVLQKVSFASTQEIQQIKQGKDSTKVTYQKQTSSSITTTTSSDIQKSISAPGYDSKSQDKEPRFTPSITSIGNAVLRSRTADFERITKADTKVESKPKTTTTTSERDKKKYTKRRYTDSRHPTRHIPDAEALEAQSKKEDRSSASQSGPVYKRRELISSVPTK